MKEMDNFELSRMPLNIISRTKYDENRAIFNVLFPKVKQITEYTDTYHRKKRKVFMSKEDVESKFVLSNEARKCECGCELWDYEGKVEMVAKNRKRDEDITLLVEKDIAETERGRRKVTYAMHPKFYELVKGSLDALLLINLGERK